MEKPGHHTGRSEDPPHEGRNGGRRTAAAVGNLLGHPPAAGGVSAEVLVGVSDDDGGRASGKLDLKATHPLRVHFRTDQFGAFAMKAKGSSLVPLKVYFKNGVAKLLVGVAVGRKKADKRAAIRDKEMKRDMDRDAGRRR